MDLINGSVDYATALGGLTQLLSQTSFQAQAENQSLYVLGMLEALAQPFEAVWVLGLDDENFPSAPNPNPFIPLWYQLKHGFPRASAERELVFAEQLRDKLLSY